MTVLGINAVNAPQEGLKGQNKHLVHDKLSKTNGTEGDVES